MYDRYEQLQITWVVRGVIGMILKKKKKFRFTRFINYKQFYKLNAYTYVSLFIMLILPCSYNVSSLSAPTRVGCRVLYLHIKRKYRNIFGSLTRVCVFMSSLRLRYYRRKKKRKEKRMDHKKQKKKIYENCRNICCARLAVGPSAAATCTRHRRIRFYYFFHRWHGVAQKDLNIILYRACE